ncbi:MAG: hypothetical protein WA842_14480 [Croceibacterium sp.]
MIQPAFDWRRFAVTPAAVLAAWAAWALLRIALLPVTGWDPSDPDDFMRLQEVRDWLNGQPWYDVAQYRMDPPHGASMHWSRLVDLPIAALIFALRTVLPQAQAELWAMVWVPLLYLLPALFALRAIALKLGLSGLSLVFVLLLLPLFPLLPGNFGPLRIDHHTAQSVAAVVCGALLVHAPSRLAAALCGIVGAAWIAISLEALPLLVVLGGLYGLRYWLRGDRSLVWYLGALALAAPLLSLATRPLSAFAEPYCDILRPGHMATFAAAALLAGGLAFAPGRGTAKGRLLGLALIPLVCGPLAFASLGTCAADPFGALDPLLKTYWHNFIPEGVPIWRQPPSVAIMLLWTVMLVPAGWWLARSQGLATGRQEESWTMLAFYALAAGAYSLLVMREALAAQLLAIPFAALLLAELLPRARAVKSTLPRIAATLGALALATPTFGSAALKPFDDMAGHDARRSAAVANITGAPCDYASLNALPPAHLFAPLDRGPEILAKTPHSVVMAGYHRNQAKMVDVVRAFTNDPAQAEAIVRRNGAAYVLACSSGKDIAAFRTARADNLANLLVEGHPPAWLEPVAGFDGSLRVYRVR